MQMNFNRLSKPELEYLIENCNFTGEEVIILKMACFGNTVVETALKLNMSVDTVTRKKRTIKRKIFDFLEVLEYMTNIYINGKHVTEEDITKYELKNKKIKEILSKKLTNAK